VPAVQHQLRAGGSSDSFSHIGDCVLMARECEFRLEHKCCDVFFFGVPQGRPYPGGISWKPEFARTIRPVAAARRVVRRVVCDRADDYRVDT
jgi:hypothetical protein